MNCVELFTGAGGLALGVERAGFKHLALVERDRESCRTLSANRDRGVPEFKGWPIFEGDVRDFDFGQIRQPVHLLAGGPPCQPFSLGGKHRGHRDQRNLFPEAVRAVRELQPEAFLFENVKGLLREAFSTWFSYILLQLKHPELTLKPGETWEAHRSRLEKHETAGRREGLHYNVIFALLNAADFGVPQRRERVFIAGIRSDLALEWSFPAPTHSREALLWEQGVTKEYWERRGLKPRAGFLESKLRAARFEKLARRGERPRLAPWRTVRDGLDGLPEPRPGRRSAVLNHAFNRGARCYPGHTGSDLDEPAKVLKAGDHGVPGGENMLARPDGAVRYFTVRESARLQTFPDEMFFPASWTESMRQIGNAVPAALGHAVASHLAAALNRRI